jgi:phospholipid/cholesterol/gamma-HCH transport system ATP-binding protein
MKDGKKEWTGNSKDIIYAENKNLNQFIFASEFLQGAKKNMMQQQPK